MKTHRKLIGERISERRKQLGFKTQSALAQAFHIDTETNKPFDRTRISKWESGREMPRGENKRRLLEILQWTENDLISELSKKSLEKWNERVHLQTDGENKARELLELAKELASASVTNVASPTTRYGLSEWHQKLFDLIPRLSESDARSVFKTISRLASDKSQNGSGTSD